MISEPEWQRAAPSRLPQLYPPPGFKLPCPLQQGKMSLSTASYQCGRMKTMITYLFITFTLLSMMISQHLLNLKSKLFFITFTFWGEVRTLKNLSCNLQLWWVMRHLEALSCSTCFLVGSQTKTSHTFLWPQDFCLVKSRGGGGGAPGSKPVNLNEIMECHGNHGDIM